MKRPFGGYHLLILCHLVLIRMRRELRYCLHLCIPVCEFITDPLVCVDCSYGVFEGSANQLRQLSPEHGLLLFPNLVQQMEGF